MNENINDILLSELEDIDYGTHYSFYDLFRRNNIRTVAQVLDDNLINNIISQCRKESIREQIFSFKSLLEYKFKGILIPNDILLDTKITDENLELIDEIISRLGFNYSQIKNYINKIISYYNNETLIDAFSKIISDDFFQNIKNKGLSVRKKEFTSTFSIIKMYVESYAKSHGLKSLSEVQELLLIKESLNALKEKRNNLDREIEEIEEKISIILTVKNEEKTKSGEKI